MFKKISLALALVLILTTGAIAVFADDYTVGPSAFTDGRLNGYDPAAPIILYEVHTIVDGVDADGLATKLDVVTAIKGVTWNGDSQNPSLAFEISSEDINKAIAEHGTGDFQIAQFGGVTLNYSASGYLWVTAPDSNGLTYSFLWAKNF